MIIYKGYYFFIKAQGRIYLRNYSQGRHGIIMGVNGKVPDYMGININDDIETQVRSVVHELAHIGLELEDLTNGPDNLPINIKDIEDKIEKISEEFCLRNPPLVNRIRTLLKRSKNNQSIFFLRPN